MRLVYLDAALASEQGHFAGVCRAVTAAVATCGMTTEVFGHASIDPGLAATINARPLFRFHPNASFNNDPLCGWLFNFHAAAQVMVEDLAKLPRLESSDYVIYDCARPAQILGLIQWLQNNFSPSESPALRIILGWPSGSVVNGRDANGKPNSWHLTEQASALYRFACGHIKSEYSGRVAFAVPSDSMAAAYSALLGCKVANMPATQKATTSCRTRGKVPQPCIAFLGEQRENKGYQYVPEIVASLLADSRPKRILVQNSWQLMEEQNNALQRIAEKDNRLQLHIGTLAPEHWSSVLEASDLIVLPYDYATYSTAASGIGSEAIANAIPQVAPANTGLADLLVEYGNPGRTFENVTPGEVTEAILAALDNLDELAVISQAAARSWAERNSPSMLGRFLLAGE